MTTLDKTLPLLTTDEAEWIERQPLDDAEARQEIEYIREMIIPFHQQQIQLHQERLAWLEKESER